MQIKSETIISLKHLSLKLKDHLVLNNLSLDIKSGDKIGLVGANGSGKTTLLRLLAGIYKEFKGSFVNQKEFFYLSSPGSLTSPVLNIIDNIKRIFYFYQITEYDHSKLKKYLEEFQLNQYLDYQLSELSQGYQLRVQIVAYLMMNFQNALIDEFFGFGDKFVMEKFELQLKNKLDNTHCLVIASHNINLINQFCNRIIHLDNGQIVKDEKLNK
ncbi:ATP-binding cassette domain-containing protein [Candidatus Pelagibacter sp.]|uniref:ATP-binding cassette domain-containing protein n=1 Tax=Candidatus Pelagibacter sp. TaxID=2024849 RepID=UPI003D0E4CAE